MKRFLQIYILSICISLSPESVSFAQNVDTTWVNHYMSGLLQGEVYISAGVTDDQGNFYVTGTIKNMLSGEDYLTAKYDPAGVPQWIAQYNGSGNSIDNSKALAVDGSGNVYVTGGSEGSGTGRDYATVKYNSNGVELWAVRYDGPGTEYTFDGANAISVDAAGNVYVTGSSDSYTDSDYATIKYNNEGVEQWVARYDGPDEEGGDDAYYIVHDASGNIYVTGRSDNVNGKDDYATIKYNADGEEHWVARYNGPDNQTDRASGIAVDDSGNVYVTGSSTDAQYKWNYATVKYNDMGVEQWSARYSGTATSNDNAKGLVVNDSGYVYVTGNAYEAGSNDDFTTIKYTPAGSEQWIIRYNGSTNGNDKATVIDMDDAGNIYVAGQSEGAAVVKYTPAGQQVWAANYLNIFSITALNLDASNNVFIAGSNYYDSAVIKFNDTGNELWAATLEGPGLSNEQPSIMALDHEGNLYVAGRSTRPNTNTDYLLIKYDPDGTEQWVTLYNGPDSSSETVTAIAVDNAGNVYLTGYSEYIETETDWVTIKYDGAGEMQWLARFNGPGDSWDQPGDLTLDDEGNVYVTGYAASAGAMFNYDFATVKYNSSGIEQWTAYYEGPAEGADQAVAIALDDSGNVYITGNSPGLTTGSDYATVKYNNQGVEKWVNRYNGPGNSTDFAVGIAVDKERNVVVTGGSRGDGTNYDYATIQYNSAGVEQWIKRYNGSGNGWDSPTDMAVNSKGDIFITGYTYGSYDNDDFLTLKYDQNGTLVWDSKYDGPAYNSDQAVSLSIGINDNVYVAGESVGHDDSYDYAVVNINPEGYREWVMRYSLRSDQPVAVVADQSGHIFVTGYTMFDYDTEVMCTTIKYTDPTVVGIVHDPTTFPDLFRLEQNYPNPFNPKTVIKYQLPASSQVDLSIFNILGQKITTLVSEQQAAGTYEVNWDASGLASGMYFYKLETPANVQVQKMLLIK